MLQFVNPLYGPITLQIKLQSLTDLDQIIGYFEKIKQRLATMNKPIESVLQTNNDKKKEKDKKKRKDKGRNGLKCWHYKKSRYI